MNKRFKLQMITAAIFSVGALLSASTISAAEDKAGAKVDHPNVIDSELRYQGAPVPGQDVKMHITPGAPPLR